MSISRVVIAAGTSLALLTLATPAALAQDASTTRRLELRFTSGALIPTGTQRAAIADAQVSGAQLSWLVRPSVAITGSFAWARSRDLATGNSPKLDVFTSDMGLELRRDTWNADGAVTLRPFVGIGAGMRSYNHRKLDVDATSTAAGYGAAGAELGVGRVGIRLEVRDYVSGFRPLVTGGKSVTRNDVVITAALRLNVQRSAQR